MHVSQKNNTAQSMWRFITLIWACDARIKVKVVCASTLTLLICLISMSLPLLLSKIVQMLADQSVHVLSIIPWLLCGYGILWTASQAIEQMRSVVASYVLEGSIRILSMRLFDHLHTLSIRFHLDRCTGAVMSAFDRAQFGLEALFWGLFLYAIPIILEMALILGVLAYLYSLLYGLIALIGMSAYVYFAARALKKTTALYEQYNEKRSRANAGILDSLLNAETVRYFSNQQYDHDQCERLLAEQERLGVMRSSTEAKIQLMQLIFIGSGICFVTWVSGMGVIANTSTIGNFVLMNGYLLQIIAPLRGFAYVMQQIRKGLQDMAAVNDLMLLQPEVVDVLNAKPLSVDNATITFDAVSFSYDSQRPILDSISFTVPAGSTVAIVGPSGVGKSTISRLLFRFYEVTQGGIRINGQDIRSVTQKSLHAAIGIVPQDTILFNNTIYYNIAYGNPSATKQEVEQAARAAQLDQFIAQLPDGYQTQVGERGLKLSGGEKQRVAIARAFLKNPSIYIFDEATSALDSHTEKEIIKTMRAISCGATTLIIAHRLSTVMHADIIVVLENGAIVEQGIHDDLLAKGAVYAQLWYNPSERRV